MLGKLIKYEMKSTSRVLLPLYAMLLVIAVINRLLSEIKLSFIEIISGFTILAFVLLVIGVGVATFIMILMRYYKNIFGDEGYLTLTLPVKMHLHVISKYITSIMWIISSIAVIILSIFILIVNTNIQTQIVNGYNEVIGIFSVELNISAALINTFIILFIILAILVSVLYLYASLSIGHLFSMNKVLGSFLGAFILYVILQIFNMLLVGGSFFIFDIKISTDLASNSIETIKSFISYILISEVVLSILLGACYFGISKYVLCKKVNLE